MSVISDHGIAIDSFERTLVKALGAERGREGANLLAEASRHGRRRVELCDWIYCLARSPGTQLAQFMVAAKGSSPDVFISSLEQGLEYDKAPNDAGTPKRLIPATVSEHVKKMLDLAALAAKSSPAGTISEQILLQALLGAGDELLVENLSFWATQEGLERFRSQLENSKDDDLTPYLMFGADGKLDVSRFAPSAKRLCRRCADAGKDGNDTAPVVFSALDRLQRARRCISLDRSRSQERHIAYPDARAYQTGEGSDRGLQTNTRDRLRHDPGVVRRRIQDGEGQCRVPAD